MRHILVVEDSASMRALVTATLEALDEPVQVTEASSGFEALGLLPRERFDLILTDVNMPDINGLELISFVRNSASHVGTPLVVISTEGSERDRERGLELGADAYLVKPIEPEELQRIARELLQKSRTGE